MAAGGLPYRGGVPDYGDVACVSRAGGDGDSGRRVATVVLDRGDSWGACGSDRAVGLPAAWAAPGGWADGFCAAVLGVRHLGISTAGAAAGLLFAAAAVLGAWASCFGGGRGCGDFCVCALAESDFGAGDAVLGVCGLSVVFAVSQLVAAGGGACSVWDYAVGDHAADGGSRDAGGLGYVHHQVRRPMRVAEWHEPMLYRQAE